MNDTQQVTEARILDLAKVYGGQQPAFSTERNHYYWERHPVTGKWYLCWTPLAGGAGMCVKVEN